jgi:hypothetical protein
LHAEKMSSKGKKPAGKAGRSAIADVVAREYTIHLHKRVCLTANLDEEQCCGCAAGESDRS